MIERNDLIPSVREAYRKYNGTIASDFNQIGVRFPSGPDSDTFNDFFLLYLPAEDRLFMYAGTTDPGKNATLKQPGGAAHLCEGFHPDMWVIDMHANDKPKFRHEAFCQRPQFGCKPVKIWRDRNRNGLEDEHVYETRNDIGLNKHRASAIRIVESIGDYSWACQVAQNVSDHEMELRIAKELDRYSKKPRCLFSYLLCLNTDIPEL